MIIVFGTVCIDRIRRVPKLPPPGGYVEIEEESVVLGGEAANTANALRAWGAEVELWGNQLGFGPSGLHLEQLLDARKLHVHVSASSQLTGTPVCDIYVTPGGERTMFGSGFSKMEAGVSAEGVTVGKVKWLTAEPNMRTVAAQVVWRAHEAGTSIYLMDFLEAEDIPPGSFWQGSTDWVGTRNDVAGNIRWLQDWTAKTETFGILSDGINGFVAGSAMHEIRHYPAYTAPQVVDTTGAGDMLRAGTIFGLAKGWGITECLRFGAAAACLNCSVVGGAGDVPSVAEVDQLMAAQPETSSRYQ